MKYEWKPGQIVAVNRRIEATIKRVTPAGRAIVDWHDEERTFNADGYERGQSTRWGRTSFIVPMTPEVAAEIVRAHRTREAFGSLRDLIRDAEKWERNNCPRWGSDLAEDGAMEQAEAIAAAIRAILPSKAVST